MGRVFPTRMLLVGHMPQKLTGMWYIFVRPEQLRAVAPGVFIFGSLHLPALRVTYDLPGEPERRRRAAGSQLADLYLAFEDSPARMHVWADLLVDSNQDSHTEGYFSAT